MTALNKVFRFDGDQVRVVIVAGEPWFVLADLCAVLAIKNPSMVAQRIPEDALSLAEVIDSLGRTQSATIVSEAGMFEVIFRSDKPEAAEFRRWVTGTVLPEIRRTGAYRGEAPKGAELLALAVLEAQQVLAAKDAQIAELEPRAGAWDDLASAEGDFSVADAAKILTRASIETGRDRLFDTLGELGWIYRQSGRWHARQRAVDRGYIRHRAQSHRNPNTDEIVIDPPQVRLTAKGIERLRIRMLEPIPELTG